MAAPHPSVDAATSVQELSSAFCRSYCCPPPEGAGVAVPPEGADVFSTRRCLRRFYVARSRRHRYSRASAAVEQVAAEPGTKAPTISRTTITATAQPSTAASGIHNCWSSISHVVSPCRTFLIETITEDLSSLKLGKRRNGDNISDKEIGDRVRLGDNIRLAQVCRAISTSRHLHRCIESVMPPRNQCHPICRRKWQ